MFDEKLSTYIAVCECGNFRKAANRLFLSQPAVSGQIKSLEKRFGTKLLIRSQDGLKITPKGELVLEYARQVQSLEKSLQSQMNALESSTKRLIVGISHVCEVPSIVQAVKRYSEDHANFSVAVLNNISSRLYDFLDSHHVDLAIVNEEAPKESMHRLLLDEIRIGCILSPSNPLSVKRVLTIDDLRRQKIILGLPSNTVRMQFERFMLEHDEALSNLSVVFESDNYQRIIDMVSKSSEISIVPENCCAEEVDKGIVSLKRIHGLDSTLPIYIAYRAESDYAGVAKDLSKLYKRMLKAQDGQG